MSAAHRSEIHVWYAYPDKVREPKQLTEFGQILSSEELAHCQSFTLDPLRLNALLTRVLVRTALSRLHPAVRAEQWRFQKNQFGCPEISAVMGIQGLHFNVSHTEGLIACAIGQDLDLGIDVENVEREVSALEVAEHSFSAMEVEFLKTLPPSELREYFFKIWTLKEAYIKARRTGFAIPLEQFSFHLPKTQEPIRISFESGLFDPRNNWNFRLLKPTPRHQLALAISGRWDPDGRITETDSGL